MSLTSVLFADLLASVTNVKWPEIADVEDYFDVGTYRYIEITSDENIVANSKTYEDYSTMESAYANITVDKNNTVILLSLDKPKTKFGNRYFMLPIVAQEKAGSGSYTNNGETLVFAEYIKYAG